MPVVDHRTDDQGGKVLSPKCPDLSLLHLHKYGSDIGVFVSYTVLSHLIFAELNARRSQIYFELNLELHKRDLGSVFCSIFSMNL